MAFRTLGHLSARINGKTPGQIKTAIVGTLKEFGFAAVVALTRTAQAIKQEQPKEMNRVFDRPKPWTLNSVFMQKATKSIPVARVWLKDQQNSNTFSLAASRAAQLAKNPTYRVSKRAGQGTPASKYLLPQITGGPRPAKGFERKMRATGILGPNEFIVPGAVKLDSYGNVSPGLYTKILSDQGALVDPMSNRAGTFSRTSYLAQFGMTEAKKRSKYFVATIKRTRAIWERLPKGGIRPILIILGHAPQYRKRYDFVGTSQRVFDAKWAGELRKAVAEGFVNAKPVRA
jgi:hypothetical protein